MVSGQVVPPHGPTDYDLGSLTPEQFETLTFLLARHESAHVVPVRNHDQGLDARLPDRQGKTKRGWQAKRHTSGINWGECEQSVRRAIAFWRPPWITFTFPLDLSAKDQDDFRTRLIEAFPQVRLDFWPDSELQRRMRDTPDGQRAANWLFSSAVPSREEMLAMVAVGGELSSVAQAATRQAVIQQFMNKDPFVFYTSVSRDPDGPETPPANETVLSMTFLIDGKEVRYDAAERYPGAIQHAGLPPTLLFEDDQAGQQAQETLQRLLAEGGRAEIQSDGGAGMPPVPVALRGLLPDHAEVTAMQAEAQTGPAAAELEDLTVLVTAGDAQLAMVLGRSGKVPPGWDVTVVGAVGGLEIFYSIRREGDSLESKLDWRHTLGEGSALEQLLACQIMLAGLRGQEIQLRHSVDGRVLISGTFDESENVEDDLAQLETVETFLGYVTEVEAWIGEPLYPPAEPSADDAQVLGWVVPLIRNPVREGTWTSVDVVPHADANVPDDLVNVVLFQPLHIRLFDQDIFMGLEMFGLTAARIERVEDKLRLVPTEETPARISLHHPDEAPAEAAVPPAGRATAAPEAD